MLTPPGQPGHAANLIRLDAVRGACRHHLPVGVDGGVTIANIDQILTAGARHIVIGRGLIEAAPGGAR
jgi:pentose-5-phosphate-3-epimerase